MRRFRALLGKEWHHHAWAALALVLLLGLCGGILLAGTAVSQDTTSILSAVPLFLLMFVPLAALFLSHRLVVLEYQGRTQLFLESLPLRRWEMVALKWVLGSLLLGPAAGTMVLAAAFLALAGEPVGPGFLMILLARALAYTLAVWSFCFLLGFMGRLRTALYLGFFVLLVGLSNFTDLHLLDFGPLALVDPSTFPFERLNLPWTAFFQTVGGTLCLAALALVLGTIREGSVAEQLSRRMSQKEKVVVALAFLSALVAFETLDQRMPKDPYTFVDGEVVASDQVPLEILYLDQDAREPAFALRQSLERQLAELQQALGWAELPALRIAWRGGLDGRTFEWAPLQDNDGVLLRANFTDPDFDAQGFSALVVHEVLDEACRDRATFDPRHWFLDGFARWWVERRSGGEIPLLRALWVVGSDPPTWPELRSWTTFSERHGDPIAEGVAFSVVKALEEEKGPEAVVALARALYGRRPFRDSRETLHEWSHPFPEVLEQQTGFTPEQLMAAWESRVEGWQDQPDYRAVLGSLPAGEGSFAIEPGQGSVRDLVYSFAFDRPPAPGEACALVHAELQPFDSPMGPADLVREEHLWVSGELDRGFRLRGRYARGQRVFVALEVEAERLGCPVRLVTERLEVR